MARRRWQDAISLRAIPRAHELIRTRAAGSNILLNLHHEGSERTENQVCKHFEVCCCHGPFYDWLRKPKRQAVVHITSRAVVTRRGEITHTRKSCIHAR